LPDSSCDAALLFFVWHHVVDRNAAARELHRVVKQGGEVFVQANFSDRRPDAWWLHVVPEWMNVHQPLYQSEQDVISDFAGAGWTLVSRDEITWLRSSSLVEDFERLRLRPTSLFEHMSEEEVEAGFARIEAALPSLDDGPQFETSALLVFER
jgi:ubiquinone/menaquinone biosynthesis C-methylase UbiE